MGVIASGRFRASPCGGSSSSVVRVAAVGEGGRVERHRIGRSGIGPLQQVIHIELHLADAGAPTLIRQNDKSQALYVLMPMRV